jgi:hypothetical protein
MIKKLTKKQERQLGEYTKKWFKIGLSTARANKPKAEKCIAEMYKNAQLKPPRKFVWVASPQRAMVLAKEMGCTYGKTPEIPTAAFVFTGMNGRLLFLAGYIKVLGIKGYDYLKPHVEVAKHCGWFLPFDEVAIVCERPTEYHFDKAGKLHNTKGPAIRYADGFAVYARHGVVQRKNGAT